MSYPKLGPDSVGGRVKAHASGSLIVRPSSGYLPHAEAISVVAGPVLLDQSSNQGVR